MSELLKDAIQLTIEHGFGSASLLQRTLRIGYNDACKMLDEMERLGIIGPAKGAIPRELLIKTIDND